MKNLTLKRILRNHKKHPEDKEIHKEIENAEVDDKLFKGLVDKASKTSPFDKK